MKFDLRFVVCLLLGIANVSTTFAETLEKDAARITAEVRDIDPANKQKVQVETLDSKSITFTWCDVNKEGGSVCATPMGCRGTMPYSSEELLDTKASKRWKGHGVVGIDLAIMAAMIGGGWRLFRGTGGEVLKAEGVALGESAFAKSAIGKGIILAADGETILSAAPLASGQTAAGVIVDAAHAAKATAPVLLTTVQKLSTWSFVGVSFTGLLVKYTRKLDPTVKYREADVIDESLWTQRRNQIWPLEEYRKTLQKVLCEIDGYDTHSF